MIYQEGMLLKEYINKNTVRISIVYYAKEDSKLITARIPKKKLKELVKKKLVKPTKSIVKKPKVQYFNITKKGKSLIIILYGTTNHS